MTLGPQFDIYGKERMAGTTRRAADELDDEDGPILDNDTFRQVAADSAVWPGESRFFSASPTPAGRQNGESFHPYGTMQVTEPMELPNFANSREHGTQALTWEPSDGLGPSWQSREVGKPFAFTEFGPDSQAKAGREQPSDQLFTHVPGRVNQADVHPKMQHTTGVLAALAHRDLPSTVPTDQHFKEDPIYISTGGMMDMASANDQDEWGVTKGRLFSEQEVRDAHEAAKAPANSRLQHFGQGVQGNLF